MLVRPRRSVLYMPGSNLRALKKARELAADALVFDLEDSVAPSKKTLAREQVIAAIKEGGYGSRELVVRVNALDGDFALADIKAVALSGADALCLPKVESASEVLLAARLLIEAGAPPSMQIWAMIETPLGILNIEQIASEHPRLAVIVMGTTDLAKSLRVPHTSDRSGLIFSLSRCVLAARVYGKDILDGVYLDLKSSDGFTHACQQGVDLGFDGKTLIHPNQVTQANKLFGPSEKTLTHARKVIQAWRQAEEQGKAVAVVDGQLVELMHVDEAKRNLMIAEAICR